MSYSYVTECKKVGSKVIIDHARKTYSGNRGTAPHIPNLGTGWN